VLVGTLAGGRRFQALHRALHERGVGGVVAEAMWACFFMFFVCGVVALVFRPRRLGELLVADSASLGQASKNTREDAATRRPSPLQYRGRAWLGFLKLAGTPHSLVAQVPPPVAPATVHWTQMGNDVPIREKIKAALGTRCCQSIRSFALT
jgi:hypothetical protein